MAPTTTGRTTFGRRWGRRGAGCPTGSAKLCGCASSSTQAEIGQSLGLSQMQVYRLLTAIFRRLRHDLVEQSTPTQPRRYDRTASHQPVTSYRLRCGTRLVTGAEFTIMSILSNAVDLSVGAADRRAAVGLGSAGMF